MTQVKCSVANCYYWKEGNRCSADEIMVEVDRNAFGNLNVEFGEIGDHRQDEADTSSTTCCRTFKPKNE